MTTTPASPRRRLPLLNAFRGGRSAMTCTYRCGDDCARPIPNPTDGASFADLAEASLSRRRLLGASVVAATAPLLLAGAGGAAAVPGRAETAGTAGRSDIAGRSDTAGLGFIPIAPVPADRDVMTVPEGFVWAPVISWGDPILPGAPEFDFDAQSPQAQAGQFGYNNDYLDILPLRGRGRGLLVANHEYTNENLMFTGWNGNEEATEEELRIVLAAHGMSVVEVQRRGGSQRWEPLRNSPYNRRITATTPFSMTGPAAGSAPLRTTADPTGTVVLGTLNNCAGGTTPWGTVLSGEENYNQYFRAVTPPPGQEAEYARYGIAGEGRGWERVDRRFDTALEPNEPNRFGWIVELDPEEPASTPTKHTALGRFKHEGATVRLADDGRAVAYMGDDQVFDYVYKFVSRERMRPGRTTADRAFNKTLLTDGDLYVARFEGEPTPDGGADGTGRWLPLVTDGVSRVPGMSVDEVLVWTRLAGDVVGATKMDRPEDVEANPVTGAVYIACTNNTSRTSTSAPNPRAQNKFGHVVELDEARGDAAALTFTWRLALVCGMPDDPSTYFAGYPKDQVAPISCPDNLAFDARGNLWISTDGQPGTIGGNDGLFCVPVEGPERGRVQQFLAVPTGAETCGPLISEDRRSVFVAVQHPGEVDGASREEPASLFPYLGDPGVRPAVVQVWAMRGRGQVGG